jgi:hypothetical protein
MIVVQIELCGIWIRATEQLSYIKVQSRGLNQLQLHIPHLLHLDRMINLLYVDVL